MESLPEILNGAEYKSEIMKVGKISSEEFTQKQVVDDCPFYIQQTKRGKTSSEEFTQKQVVDDCPFHIQQTRRGSLFASSFHLESWCHQTAKVAYQVDGSMIRNGKMKQVVDLDGAYSESGILKICCEEKTVDPEKDHQTHPGSPNSTTVTVLDETAADKSMLDSITNVMRKARQKAGQERIDVNRSMIPNAKMKQVVDLNGAYYELGILKAKNLLKNSHRSKSLMIVPSTFSKLEEQVDGSMIPNEKMKQVVDLDGAEYKSRIMRKSEKMCHYQQFEYDGKKQIEEERPTDGNVGRLSAGANRNVKSIQRQIEKWSEPAKAFYEKSHKEVEEPSEDVLVAAARYGATYASVAF
uniref:Uncharacterized protein n=1 Tax=Ditylenchus dipsaci TaxID=166011 RepID=A0A915CZZ4_9BILA